MADPHRFARVLSYAQEQPWALLPTVLAEIRMLLARRAAGEPLTDEEIAARLGPKDQRAQPPREGVVAVIKVHGVIAHRMNLFSDISGGTSTELLEAQVRAAIAEPAITRLVLDVNSPGGGVFGLPELAQTIREARAVKPITAVVNALMASAAYWLGSAATEIVATPSAQVGSIGVFALHQDHSKELAEAGVDVTVIGAGKYKTETLPFAPLSAEARAAIQRQVDTYYGMFVRDVAQGRQTTVAAVREGYGEGRTLDATAAREAGMIDRIATLDEVLQEASQAGGRQAPAALAAAPPAVAVAPSADFDRRRARLAELTRGRRPA